MSSISVLASSGIAFSFVATPLLGYATRNMVTLFVNNYFTTQYHSEQPLADRCGLAAGIIFTGISTPLAFWVLGRLGF
jgi:hypothetical protein